MPLWPLPLSRGVARSLSQGRTDTCFRLNFERTGRRAHKIADNQRPIGERSDIITDRPLLIPNITTEPTHPPRLAVKSTIVENPRKITLSLPPFKDNLDNHGQIKTDSGAIGSIQSPKRTTVSITCCSCIPLPRMGRDAAGPTRGPSGPNTR